jgi:hypothetical protein
MQSKRSTPSCSDGLTIIELLVGLTITLGVTTAGFALARSGLSLYESDHGRIRLHQNLRAAHDSFAADIRQAGERLGEDFPAIEIRDGAAGAPDELILRRNLLGTVLTSCRDVEDDDFQIYIAELVGPPTLPCTPVPDDNGDFWPDNHGTWRNYRMTHGFVLDGELAVLAYLYNPQTGQGEFFPYWWDEPATATIEAHPDHVWQFDYPAADQPRVYILEERRYRLNGDLLQLIINADDTNPLSLVDQIVDLQLAATMQDGSQLASFGFADVWSDLRAIDLTLRGRRGEGDRTVTTEWASEIVPRNVLSH